MGELIKQYEKVNLRIERRGLKKMYRVHPKQHAYIFSPLQMLYNYFNQTKNSINQFLNQYLKPQGKSTLLTFNRYMILVVILNIDLKLLILLIFLIFIIVKLLKLRISYSKIASDLPHSYVTKLKQVQKLSVTNKKLSTNKKQTNIKPSTTINQEKISPEHQNNDLSPNKQAEMKQKIITNIEPEQIQHKIYEWINQAFKTFTKLIWFTNWKSILYMWIMVVVIYLFEPLVQSDDYHIITSTDDGELQIESIKKASEYLNYFHLIFLWISLNVVIFFQNRTKKLQTQLLQELFNKQYTYNIIKTKKLKTKRFSSRIDPTLKNIHQFNNSLLSENKMYKTLIIKKNEQKPIDIKNLIDFSITKLQTHQDDIQLRGSSRKLSHDIPQSSPPNSPLSHRQNKVSRQQIRIEFAESQEESQEQVLSIKKQSQLTIKKQKKQISSTVQKVRASERIVNHIESKNKMLQRKNNFNVIVNSQNLIKRKRKSSQQFRKQQQYNDFRIHLLQVELSDSAKLLEQIKK